MPTPLWQTGFRPFFLGAAIVATAVAAGWAAALGGGLSPPAVLGPVAWHVHELLYGFGGAVLAGFLLTAAAVWTGRPTVSGIPLMVLVALWGLGRGFMLVDVGLPGWALALPDALWMTGVAVGVGIPIMASRNTRNLGFPVLMLGLATCHTLPLALPSAGGWLWRLSWLVALDLVVVALVLVSGRIVPMFSRNGLQEPRIGRWTWADRTAVALSIALVAADALTLPGWAAGSLGLAAAAALLVRAIPWKSWLAWRMPLVWVLHLGVAWIALGMALTALTRLGAPLPTTMGTHALTVGAIGTTSLGMMARVALGHSGRPLVVGPVVVLAFWLVTVAAVARVAGPLVSASPWVLVGAAALFALAFAAYLGGYLRVLLAPRVDGKPG